MQKIIIISQYGTSHVGGVPRVVEILESILKENKYDVLVVSEKNLTSLWLNILMVLTFGKLKHVFVSLAASLWLRKNAGDALIIANGYDAFAYSADIVFAHSINAGIKHNLQESVLQKAFSITSMIEKKAYHKCRKIVAVSENIKHDLMTFYRISPDKIVVIENIIDSTQFYPSRQSPASKKISYCGAIKKAKGLPLLMKLAEEVSAQNTYSFELLCPHSFPEFNAFPRVFVTSASSSAEIAAHYQHSCVLFFPSKYEGFSMAVLEALACGIPVVLTEKHTGFAQTLASKFKEGIYFITPEKPLLAQIDAIVSSFDVRKSERVVALSQKINDHEMYKKKIIDLIRGVAGNKV